MTKVPLVCRAYAKINLTLEILGKRPDGYHDLATVMQSVALHDTLEFEPAEEVSLFSDNPALMTPDNLVLRAARELQMYSRLTNGCSVKLKKTIPLAAGLGGGSSDAACTLSALNELWGLALPIERLSEIAARIGSDVPFFLYDGTALAEGRGEIITPLPPFPKYIVLLVCPRIQIPNKTRVLYGKVKPSDYSDGSASRELVNTLRQRRPVGGVKLVNTFLPIVLSESPVVRSCYDRMIGLGITPYLSGAGPTLFALMENESEARLAKESLADLDADLFLTHTISSSEERSPNDQKNC